MIWNLLFKHKFLTLFVYHPTLLIYNLIRNPLGIFKMFANIIFKLPYTVYGFKIYAPYKLNNSFFANINTHYNSFIQKGYEEDEMKLISEHLEPNDSVLELGGCLGVISCLINKKLNNPDNHVVFEISPRNFKYLERNKYENGCQFKCVLGVISNNNDTFFNESNNFLGGKKNDSFGEKVLNKVKTNELSNFDIPFNLLIMDIEGGEVDIFNELDLTPFNKIIYENHFSHKFISKKELEIIEKKLTRNLFFKKTNSGNVDYWVKLSP